MTTEQPDRDTPGKGPVPRGETGGLSEEARQLALDSLGPAGEPETRGLLDAYTRRLLGDVMHRRLAKERAEALEYACGFVCEKTARVYDPTSRVERTLFLREYTRALRFVMRETLADPVHGPLGEPARRLAQEVMDADADLDPGADVRRILDPETWATALDRLRRAAEEDLTDELERECRAHADDDGFLRALLYAIGAELRRRDEEAAEKDPRGILAFLERLGAQAPDVPGH